VSKHNFNAEVAPELMAYLGEAGIALVDIGGRGAAMNQLMRLAPVSAFYACEPDAAEAERMREAMTAEPWRSFAVIPAALALRRGDALLHITEMPGMSSLLEPDPDVLKPFYLRHKYNVVRTESVPVISLDDAAVKYGFEDACFLKLDTQGSELDIIQSGARLLPSVLGLYVETSFRPLYKRQALFGDVDAYLRSNGFALFSMDRVSLRRAGFRQTLYSKRITAWAHCLYLREPDTLDPAAEPRHLPRLLAIAMAFQHYDLAFELMERIRHTGLLTGERLERVAADVERVIDWDSDYQIRKAQKRGLDEDVLAPAFRDRHRFE
jgi:FkbM family methyltransferase